MTTTDTPEKRPQPTVEDPIYHGHGFGLRENCPKCDAYRRAVPCPPRDLGEKFYD